MAMYKVTIETTNKKLLKAIKAEELPRQEADDFRQQMLDKKKRHGKRIAIFAGIFLISIPLMILSIFLEFPQGVSMVFSACMLFGPAFALFECNGLYVAGKYLKALGNAYPAI